MLVYNFPLAFGEVEEALDGLEVVVPVVLICQQVVDRPAQELVGHRDTLLLSFDRRRRIIRQVEYWRAEVRLGLDLLVLVDGGCLAGRV